MNRHLAKAFKSAFYGNSYFCPICNNNLKKFLATREQNCPLCNCNNFERAAMLIMLAHYPAYQKKLKILVIDCTSSLHVLISKLQEMLHLVTVFSYGTLGDKEGNGFNMMLNLHYPKDSFDIILAPFFLERVYNEAHFCQELQRVLIDDGLLLTAFDLDLKREKTFEIRAFEKSARFSELGNHNYFRRYGADYQSRLASNKFYVQISCIKIEMLQLCQAFSPWQIIRENANLAAGNNNIELFVQEQMQDNRQNRNFSDIISIALYYLYSGWNSITNKMVRMFLLKSPFFNTLMLPIYSIVLFMLGWILFCLIPVLGLPLGCLFMLAGITVIIGMLTSENITGVKKAAMSIVTICLFCLTAYPAILFFQYSMGYAISAGVHSLNGVKPDIPQKESAEQNKLFRP